MNSSLWTTASVDASPSASNARVRESWVVKAQSAFARSWPSRDWSYRVMVE